MMNINEDFSILFHRFFFPPGPAGPLAFSVFIPDARIISISSNLSVVIKIRMRMIMKMMRMIMKMMRMIMKKKEEDSPEGGDIILDLVDIILRHPLVLSLSLLLIKHFNRTT